MFGETKRKAKVLEPQRVIEVDREGRGTLTKEDYKEGRIEGKK